MATPTTSSKKAFFICPSESFSILKNEKNSYVSLLPIDIVKFIAPFADSLPSLRGRNLKFLKSEEITFCNITKVYSTTEEIYSDVKILDEFNQQILKSSIFKFIDKNHPTKKIQCLLYQKFLILFQTSIELRKCIFQRLCCSIKWSQSRSQIRKYRKIVHIYNKNDKNLTITIKKLKSEFKKLTPSSGEFCKISSTFISQTSLYLNDKIFDYLNVKTQNYILPSERFNNLWQDQSTYLSLLPKDLLSIVGPYADFGRLPTLKAKKVKFLKLKPFSLNHNHKYLSIENFISEIKVLYKFNREILKTPLFKHVNKFNSSKTISPLVYQQLLLLFKQSAYLREAIITRVSESYDFREICMKTHLEYQFKQIHINFPYKFYNHLNLSFEIKSQLNKLKRERTYTLSSSLFKHIKSSLRNKYLQNGLNRPYGPFF